MYTLLDDLHSEVSSRPPEPEPEAEPEEAEPPDVRLELISMEVEEEVVG